MSRDVICSECGHRAGDHIVPGVNTKGCGGRYPQKCPCKLTAEEVQGDVSEPMTNPHPNDQEQRMSRSKKSRSSGYSITFTDGIVQIRFGGITSRGPGYQVTLRQRETVIATRVEHADRMPGPYRLTAAERAVIIDDDLWALAVDVDPLPG